MKAYWFKYFEKNGQEATVRKSSIAKNIIKVIIFPKFKNFYIKNVFFFSFIRHDW